MFYLLVIILFEGYCSPVHGCWKSATIWNIVLLSLGIASAWEQTLLQPNVQNTEESQAAQLLWIRCWVYNPCNSPQFPPAAAANMPTSITAFCACSDLWLVSSLLVLCCSGPIWFLSVRNSSNILECWQNCLLFFQWEIYELKKMYFLILCIFLWFNFHHIPLFNTPTFSHT